MSARRLRRIYRIIGTALALAAAVLLLSAVAIQFRIRVANDWQQYAAIPVAQAPTKASSIVVFSPHADDETLGCGGLLATAISNGAKVRVVLMTNGDGFWFAASRAYKSVRLTPDRIISFAERRQQETLAALETQSVNPSQVTFLGYPDRGLALMWDAYWSSDSLYTSRTTGRNYSPYTNSYTPRAPYCGESVLNDVSSILKATRPTDIYVPHPLDNHPDHYATYCFVMAALEQLHSEGDDVAKKIRVHTYLVHRGDWPVPRGDRPESHLVPPHAMATGDTKWESLQLSPDIAQMKREAIGKYKTQTAVEKGFLMSFARPNELFGSIPDRTVATVEPGTMSVDGATSDWAGIPPVVVDAVGDYVVAGMSKGGDVRAIYACKDNGYLYIRLDCVRKLSKRVNYTITLRGIGSESTNDLYAISIKPRAKQATGASDWAYKAKVLEVALPLNEIHLDNDLFVRVQTKLMDLTVDNTGWHSMELASPKISKKPGPKSPA